jgi:hypothetical protein
MPLFGNKSNGSRSIPSLLIERSRASQILLNRSRDGLVSTFGQLAQSVGEDDSIFLMKLDSLFEDPKEYFVW